MTAASAAVESDSECLERAGADVRALDVDRVAALPTAPPAVGAEMVGVLAVPGVLVVGVERPGAVEVLVVVAGATALAGVVTLEAPVAPGCTLADAGIGKVGVGAVWVGVEPVPRAIADEC
jgi:hypothetical protein